MDRVPDRERRQVHLDEFGQVHRQAAHVDLAQDVGDEAALLLDRGRFLRVDEVQRHLDVDLLVRRDSLEVDVLHLQLERMHVDRPQQHLLLRAVQGERQDRRVKLLVAELVVQRVVIELDADRGFLAPVENPRDLPAVAQAAARTPPLPFARLRDDFDCHVGLSLIEAAPATRRRR